MQLSIADDKITLYGHCFESEYVSNIVEVLKIYSPIKYLVADKITSEVEYMDIDVINLFCKNYQQYDKCWKGKLKSVKYFQICDIYQDFTMYDVIKICLATSKLLTNIDIVYG